jgi:hypothetical protein
MRLAGAIGRLRLYVRYLDGLPSFGDAPERCSGNDWQHRMASPRFDKGPWRCAMQRNCAEGIALVQIQRPKFGLAYTRRIGQHGLEYGVQVSR